MCTAGPFETERQLQAHKCQFASKWSTQDQVQSMYHDIQRNNNTFSDASCGRVAAARQGQEDHAAETAVNGSYFAMTLSDDSMQNVSHLLAHRMGALDQLKRVAPLAKRKKYISKTDGASNYTSAVSWLALRVLHEVKPEWPRCLESLTSQKGDGKIGNDRFHAEVAAKKKRALATGMNQTNAMEHAKALVSNGGMKAAVVAVVHVPRNCDTKLYQSLEVKRGKPKTKQEAGPRLEEMSLSDWFRAPGACNIKPIKFKADERQLELATQFVDACFREGMTKDMTKIRPGQCRDKMCEAKDDQGRHKFGPGPRFSHGPVWSTSKITGRYSKLLTMQKVSPELVSNDSKINCMTALGCGVGPQKCGYLAVLGVETLGQLLELSALEDDALTQNYRKRRAN